MAFVESAILKLIDQVSGPLGKINANLRAFEATYGRLAKTVQTGANQQIQAFGNIAAAQVRAQQQATAAHAKAMQTKAQLERADIARQIATAKVEERRLQNEAKNADKAAKAKAQAAMEAARAQERAAQQAVRSAEKSARDQERVQARQIRDQERAQQQMVRAQERATREQARVADRAERQRVSRELASARMESRRLAMEARDRARDPGYFGRYPENIPGIAARYAAWRTVSTGHAAASEGGRGILEATTERTAQELQGLTPDQITLLQKQAQILGKQYRNISIAGIAELGRNAIPNLRNADDAGTVMELMARNAAALAVVYRDGSKGVEAVRQMYRGADMAKVADDPARLTEWIDQMTRATVVAGRDINAMQLGNTVARMGTLKMSLRGDAIGDIVALQDEARGMTANYLRTFYNDLTRSNLAKNNMGAMIGAGIRTRDGLGATNQTLLGADPFMWVMKELKPRLQRMGVDFSKRDTDPAAFTAEVQRALNKMGFLQSGMQYALWALAGEDEIKRGREKRRAVRTDQEFVKELPDKDLATGLESVKQKYRDAADALTRFGQPLFGGALGGLSGFFGKIAENPMAYGVGGLGAAGLATAGAYALNNPGSVAHVAAAGMHMRAAGALMAAAGALGGRGALGGLLGGAAAGSAARQAALAKAAALGFPTGAASAAGAAGATAAGGMLARVGGGLWAGVKGVGRFLLNPWVGGALLADGIISAIFGKGPLQWGFEKLAGLWSGSKAPEAPKGPEDKKPAGPREPLKLPTQADRRYQALLAELDTIDRAREPKRHARVQAELDRARKSVESARVREAMWETLHKARKHIEKNEPAKEFGRNAIPQTPREKYLEERRQKAEAEAAAKAEQDRQKAEEAAYAEKEAAARRKEADEAKERAAKQGYAGIEDSPSLRGKDVAPDGARSSWSIGGWLSGLWSRAFGDKPPTGVAPLTADPTSTMTRGSLADAQFPQSFSDGVAQAQSSLSAALTSGADTIAASGISLQSAIEAGGGGAAGSIQAAFDSGGASAAAMIQAALANATINVNAVGPASSPADTGANPNVR